MLTCVASRSIVSSKGDGESVGEETNATTNYISEPMEVYLIQSKSFFFCAIHSDRDRNVYNKSLKVKFYLEKTAFLLAIDEEAF